MRWRANQASTLLARLVSTEPDSGRAWCLFARAHLGADRYAEAVEAANRAAAIEPGEEWPHRLASNALMHLGNHAEALRVPVLVMWGAGDRFSSIDWAQSSLTNFSPLVIREFEQPSTATVSAVDVIDASTVLIGGDNGWIAKTADGGTTWTAFQVAGDPFGPFGLDRCVLTRPEATGLDQFG